MNNSYTNLVTEFWFL
jgi:hypothetical protein